jgi:hypothetical protein
MSYCACSTGCAVVLVLLSQKKGVYPSVAHMHIQVLDWLGALKTIKMDTVVCGVFFFRCSTGPHFRLSLVEDA